LLLLLLLLLLLQTAGSKGEDKWAYEVLARSCSWLQ
jgi:hypothetical protein